MLSREFTYEDFLGNVRTETCWFGYLESELTYGMLQSEGTDFLTKLKEVINLNDTAKLMAFFRDMILGSYGVISADGRRFDKSKELSEAFSHTQMYDMLFAELTNDTDKALEFMRGIMPAERKKFNKSNFDRIQDEVSSHPAMANVVQMSQPTASAQPVAPQPVAPAQPTQPASYPPIQ